MRKLKIILLSFSVFICSYANNAVANTQQKTQAQIEFERISETLSSAKAKFDECKKSISENNSIKTVNELILKDQNDDRKLEFLTSKKIITKEYKLAIKEAFPISNKCRGIALEGIAKAHTDLANVQANGYASFDFIMVDVINDKIKTISELNRKYLEALSTYNSNWDEVEKRVTSYLEQQHSAELQGRRVEQQQRKNVTSTAIQNWMNAQQLFNKSLSQQNYINQATKPTYTNCNVVGNTVNCSSY